MGPRRRSFDEEPMPETLPLHERHVAAGGRFGEADGWLVPLDYGDPAAEHAAVREEVGVIDRSERGKVEVTGGDRAAFLHGLLANDIKGLVPGHGCLTALLDVHGKVTALLGVSCLEDRLVLEMDRGLLAPVLATVDRYLFSERVEVEDVSAAWGVLTVAGPSARKALERAAERPVPDLARGEHVLASWAGLDVRLVRGEDTGEEQVDVWVPVAGLAEAWDRVRDAGARPVGRDAWNVLRVEAGVVRHGVDVDAGMLLPEAPLADAYSLTKGCYLGQEVVARVTYRGHVNRKLVGLRFDGTRIPPAGAPVVVGDREIGRVTSAVVSPTLRRGLAFAVLRREHAEPGTRVQAGTAAGHLPAEVATLPFYRRSPAA
jgi:aminomethyltransferase